MSQSKKHKVDVLWVILWTFGLAFCLVLAFLVAQRSNINFNVSRAATTFYVSSSGNDANSGTKNSPYKTLAKGVGALQPGDTLIILPGTYNETLTSVRSGTAQAPITVRSEQGRGSVLITKSGQVLSISHEHLVVDGLTFDAQYSAADAARVTSGGNFFKFLNSELRRAGRDCMDMSGPDNVLIENSLIHHCLYWDPAVGRADAHGIAAGGSFTDGLIIRNTEIHSFSGDALQIDPGRNANGWRNVVVENSHFWLGPLPSAQNGYSAGMVPGENAIDTKISGTAPRGTLHIRNNVFNGYRNGLISNMAALNLKENISAIVEGNEIYDSEIALRLRGPGSNGGAEVIAYNNLIYNASTAVRYEDNINNLRLFNNTFGSGITVPFHQAGTAQTNPVFISNLLVYGTSMPAIAKNSSSSRLASGSDFVNMPAYNYHLASGSLALDAGVFVSSVQTDKDGVARPQGSAYDVGAYEFANSSGPPPPPPGLLGDLNSDRIVNSIDWSIMNSKWLTSDPVADLNKDGLVNTVDFSIMNGNWLKTI